MKDEDFLEAVEDVKTALASEARDCDIPKYFLMQISHDGRWSFNAHGLDNASVLGYIEFMRASILTEQINKAKQMPKGGDRDE